MSKNDLDSTGIRPVRMWREPVPDGAYRGCRWPVQCAARLLQKDDFLFIYGPFEDHGEYTAEANQATDPVIHSAGGFEWGL
ncbi:DUF938 domain-containing protein [Methyloterricola oryzae]|uniref:DUF938 domain-containing protein n=1 Tax=Methyloterricola oryzae TaxID=1495050 RepID=UPI00069A2D50|nr:DUF938 domain-containing protein [Methyloterricola oryzae]